MPHPPAIAVCEDASVLGRPFYLMGFVDGWSPIGRTTWPEPFDTDLQARSGLGYQLAEGIALLSKVDWQARGCTGSAARRTSTSGRSAGGRRSSSG